MPPDSIIRRLQSHELGLIRCNYRSSVLALRSLIKDPASSFQLVWHAESKKPIYYDDHKIFFEEFTKVYGLWGVNGQPSLLYLRPEKISFEEVVIQTTKVNQLPVPADLFAPLFAGLTRSNTLVRYNVTTGKKLDTIFLGPLFKFVHLSWQVTGETLLLQSVYFKKGGFQNDTCLQALAFVSVNPFKFIAMIELTTDMVGTDAKNANVGEDILIIGCPGKQLVQLYSMRDVLSEKHSERLCGCDFGQQCSTTSSPSHGRVGCEGFGLPITHRATSMPPVLFQIKTSDHSVHFGGFPMHYLFKPPGKDEVFKLKDLMSDRLVQVFDVKTTQCGTDKCLFHYDESGRIIVMSTCSVRVLKFRTITMCEVGVGSSETANLPIKLEEGDTFDGTELVSQFVLQPLPAERSTVRQENVSPNRCSRPRRSAPISNSYNLSNYCYGYHPERPLLGIDHENETEFLSILGIAQEDRSSSICIFDNMDGSFVKRIPVPDLAEEDDHKMIVDLDHVIHISKTKQRHQISVYQLTRDGTTSKLMNQKGNSKWTGSTRINEVSMKRSEDGVETRSKKVKRDPRR